MLPRRQDDPVSKTNLLENDLFNDVLVPPTISLMSTNVHQCIAQELNQHFATLLDMHQMISKNAQAQNFDVQAQNR